MNKLCKIILSFSLYPPIKYRHLSLNMHMHVNLFLWIIPPPSKSCQRLYYLHIFTVAYKRPIFSISTNFHFKINDMCHP